MSAASGPAPPYYRPMATDPHPVTGASFTSPVPPGTGWPGDRATAATPVAQSAFDVVGLATTAATLSELDARVSVCRACPRLVEWREAVAATGRRASLSDQPYWGRPVPSFGDEHANTVVVGLAPAANGGNRTGRVFTGDKSGDWLFAALHRAGYASQPAATHSGDGMELSGLRILAAVRCAPPENKPTVVERDACGPWLDRELSLLMPSLKVILALGSFGWDSVLRAARRLGWTVPRPKPRFGHAAEARLGLPDGGVVTLIGSFHVSQHNTFTGRLTERMLDSVLVRVRQVGDDAR